MHSFPVTYIRLVDTTKRIFLYENYYGYSNTDFSQPAIGDILDILDSTDEELLFLTVGDG